MPTMENSSSQKTIAGISSSRLSLFKQPALALPPRCDFEENLWKKLEDKVGFFGLAKQLQPTQPPPIEFHHALKEEDEKVKLRDDHKDKMQELEAVFKSYKDSSCISSFTTVPSINDPFELDKTAKDYEEPVDDWMALENMAACIGPEDEERLFAEMDLIAEDIEELQLMKREEQLADTTLPNKMMKTPAALIGDQHTGNNLNGHISRMKEGYQRRTSTPKESSRHNTMSSPNSSPIDYNQKSIAEEVPRKKQKVVKVKEEDSDSRMRIDFDDDDVGGNVENEER